MTNKSRSKSNNPSGRPRKYGNRKTITVSLAPTLLEWVDAQAKNNDCSRNELINSLLAFGVSLQVLERLEFTKHGGIAFRTISDPDTIVDQVESGLIRRGGSKAPNTFVFTNERARKAHDKSYIPEVERGYLRFDLGEDSDGSTVPDSNQGT